MSVEHVEDLIDLEALGALDAEESAFVRAHVADCAACRAQLVEAEDTATRLALAAPMHRAPAALRDRVLAAVSARPQVVPIAAAPTALMRFNRRWGAMAAMLLLVPVGGLLTWAYVLQNQVNDLKQQNQQIAEEQRNVVLLATTPTVRARFTPTEQAGTATGMVTWNPDEGKCFVSVRGLPKAEPGTAYHVLYQNMRGVRNAGELKPDESGQAGLIFDVSNWRGDTYNVWVAAVRPGADEGTVLLQASLNRQ